MSHECPICYQTCFCHGDIGDLCLNTEEAICACTHCSELDKDWDDDWDDEAEVTLP